MVHVPDVHLVCIIGLGDGLNWRSKQSRCEDERRGAHALYSLDQGRGADRRCAPPTVAAHTRSPSPRSSRHLTRARSAASQGTPRARISCLKFRFYVRGLANMVDSKLMVDRPSSSPGATAQEVAAIPLVEERLSIAKRQVESGKVRVRVTVEEHQETVTEQLMRDDLQ